LSEIWLLLLFWICSLSFSVVVLQRVLGGLESDLTWSKLGDGGTREERDEEEERIGSLDFRSEYIILSLQFRWKKKIYNFIQMLQKQELIINYEWWHQIVFVTNCQGILRIKFSRLWSIL